MAAYERYVTGQGFQIGLVNAATGAPRALPAGVNTAADEFHPALSPDGRFLVFVRAQLQPQLNGNVAMPQQRDLVWVDLQAGKILPFPLGARGTGPNFTQRSEALGPEFTWGIPPEHDPASQRSEGAATLGRYVRLGTNNPPVGAIGVPADLTPDPTLQIPHAAAIQPLLTERITNAGCSGTCFSPRFARYLTLAQLDPGSGALLNSVARLTLVGPADNAPDLRTAILKTATFGSPANPAGHPVPRSGDGHVAFEELNGPETDLLSVPFPASTTPDVAPAPITTAASERMPAWSPDGLQLGFVRTTGGRRKLGVYDLTPGIQTIVNPLVDLGPDAPTPQTRAFQSIWGGISLSAITATPRR